MKNKKKKKLKKKLRKKIKKRKNLQKKKIPIISNTTKGNIDFILNFNCTPLELKKMGKKKAENRRRKMLLKALLIKKTL